MQREDDKAETVAKRLDVYDERDDAADRVLPHARRRSCTVDGLLAVDGR